MICHYVNGAPPDPTPKQCYPYNQCGNLNTKCHPNGNITDDPLNAAVVVGVVVIVVVVIETWRLGPLEKGFPSKR